LIPLKKGLKKAGRKVFYYQTIWPDADDNHKVSMVTALKDVDKAKAYWGSDAIKKRIEAGGLTTQPQRFIFNIVARY
jgi:hypothetical protein